jgi:hypothetical protein
MGFLARTTRQNDQMASPELKGTTERRVEGMSVEMLEREELFVYLVGVGNTRLPESRQANEIKKATPDDGEMKFRSSLPYHHPVETQPHLSYP